MKHLERFEPYAYAALRIISGLLFSCHGMQKVLGLFTNHARPEMWSQIWIGGVIELSAGLLIAFGLFTRAAAFLASGMMAVAYIQFHWKGALDEQFLPIVNDGELSVVYCFLFLLFFFRGAGSVSIDHHIT